MHRFCNLLLAIYITPLFLGKLAFCVSSCICERQNQVYRKNHELVRSIGMYKVMFFSKHLFKVHMETSLCCQSTGRRPSS